MDSIVPPGTDTQDQRCREFLGITRGGFCGRPARQMALGSWVCPEHAASRNAYSQQMFGRDA